MKDGRGIVPEYVLDVGTIVLEATVRLAGSIPLYNSRMD